MLLFRQPLGGEHLQVCIVSVKGSQGDRMHFLGKKIGDRQGRSAFAGITKLV